MPGTEAAQGPAKAKGAEPLWDIEDLAAYLKTTTAAIYYLRYQRKAPPAAKVGRELRWDPVVVRQWLVDRTEGAVSAGRPVVRTGTTLSSTPANPTRRRRANTSRSPAP